MKTAYILFSRQKPENNKAILDLIAHFCREHFLIYRAHPDLNCSTITIDGYDYNIDLLEINGESEPTYWMIYCSLHGKTCNLKNHTAA